MPVAQIPPFPPNKEAIEVGVKIKQLYDEGVFNVMILNDDFEVHCK